MACMEIPSALRSGRHGLVDVLQNSSQESRAQEQQVNMPAPCCSSSMLVGPAIETLCWRENLARTSRAYASMCGNCSFCARAKHLHRASHLHKPRSVLCFRALQSLQHHGPKHRSSADRLSWQKRLEALWRFRRAHQRGMVASALRRLLPADTGSRQRGAHFLRRCSRWVCLASAPRLGGPLLARGAAERDAESTTCASMASACTSAALSPLCWATCMASVRASVPSCIAHHAWTPCELARITEAHFWTAEGHFVTLGAVRNASVARLLQV